MIKTAVIPAAGYGTRMRPLTVVIPKEMFPLGHLPIIEHTIIELITSGIKRICVVIRKGKEIIEEYFSQRKGLYDKIEFYFAYQKSPLGLGNALRSAKNFIGNMPFIMAIPDQILLSRKPAASQLIDAFNNAYGIWNSMIKIPNEEIAFFKGSRPFEYIKMRNEFYIIKDISLNEDLLIRGFGRTVFLPEALQYMTEEFIDDETGEVSLLKTFWALKNKFPLYGIVLRGKPCDVGTWEGYYFYQDIILRYLNSKEKFS